METIDELRAFLQGASQDGARDRLLDRGAAWALMRKAGVLPADAPPFSATIDTALAEYGFSILQAALALREQEGTSPLVQRSFERVANTFEALVRNGPPEATERGLFRTISAASYHLAGFSAIAYSLFNQQFDDPNLTPGERALTLLILRDLTALRAHIQSWLLDEANSDQAIEAAFEREDFDVEDALSVIINSSICRALAFYDFALQTGEEGLVEEARTLFARSANVSADTGMVSSWWVTRLCQALIDDLWAHSLHVNLPTEPPQGGERKYTALRRDFLASLYGRKSAEVELWPSQREAAQRCIDISDDLVAALPTSAGKTRIAELASLVTLSLGKRVLLVTPLRALSAQTERSFRKSFGPLGFSVSSLYGAIGMSAGDENVLRSREIIIATPEKLDFALRSDPDLIADVGLIVLDEGHMIGPTDREIRYEILVQRLLRRADAQDRRIVCLSAILPDGDELRDLTAWIRGDVAGEPIKSDWRPTRQHFGSLTWLGQVGRLKFDLEDDGPFLKPFVERVAPRGRQRNPLPRNNRDLALFAAWEFARQGKRTLIFSTQANWVESYGRDIVDLVQRGYLQSLLAEGSDIARALTIGREWLGDDHPAVRCLEIGVAIHHGRLPNPFLRELEALLSSGVLHVAVASPTLSQGLNLNAAVLLVPSLHRAGALIPGEEFANVAGRAGRAFVDVEGLVLHTMYTGEEWRIGDWKRLVDSAKFRSLRSGLILVVGEILSRLAQGGILTRDDAFEYLANSRDAWEEPEPIVDPAAPDQEPLSHLVEKLDAVVLGLIEALDADADDLPRLLDEALRGSLWERQISAETDDIQEAHRFILRSRANLIWENTTPASRKGHFGMGVGLEAGLALDDMAEELGAHLDEADDAALRGDVEVLTDSLVELADRLLTLRPFAPDGDELPDGWEDLLRAWISGTDVEQIGAENMRFVEDAFCYRLVWALEALRTRRVALGQDRGTITGGAAASLETGVPHFSMSLLIRAGLPSRRAAMKAIELGEGMLLDGQDMRTWLSSNKIAAFTDGGDWPTTETASLWKQFRDDILNTESDVWEWSEIQRSLADGAERPTDGLYRLDIEESGTAWIVTPDFRRLVPLKMRVQDNANSQYIVQFVDDSPHPIVKRYGRGRARWIRPSAFAD